MVPRIKPIRKTMIASSGTRLERSRPIRQGFAGRGFGHGVGDGFNRGLGFAHAGGFGGFHGGGGFEGGGHR
jgi:hypothetical protein